MLTTEGEAKSIGETGGSGPMEDEGSKSNGVKENSVLTEAMLKEEQRLHDAESRESSSEREKVTLEYKYFHCLPHLSFLSYDNIYMIWLPFPSLYVYPPTHSLK